MEKVPTNGDQVNQLVDINLVGTQFVQFYYQKWISNPQEIFQSGIVKDHTRIKYKNTVYKGNSLLQLHTDTHAKGISFQLNDIQVLDSGGRRADILVVGKLKETTQSQEMTFSQYFTIANNKENWFLHNSLLSIF
jgi:hypothetical protein